MAFENNYVLGKGELYFARRDANGVLSGERYIGNTPEFTTSFESENLDHYSSDRGVREKDETVVLQINRTGTLITDNVSPQNIALFFFGSASVLTTAQRSVAAYQVGETGVGVEAGMYYQLGTTNQNPSGDRGVIFPGDGATQFELKYGSVTLDAGVHYEVDADLGRVYLRDDLPTTIVPKGSVLTAKYTVRANSRERVISGSTPIEGALRFIAKNPTGKNVDYYMPSVKLAPNGEYSLKSEEWQQIPFNIEILKMADREAVYADGAPKFV